MATEDELRKKKPNSFSDIPRDGAVVVPTTGLMGAPAMPASGAPLPMLSANLPAQPTPAQAAMPPPAAPVTPGMGYPQPTYQQQGIPTSFTPPAAAPAVAQRDPMMEAVTAPARALGAGIASVYSGAGKPPPATNATVDPVTGAINIEPNPGVTPAAVVPAAAAAAPRLGGVAPAAPGGVNPAVNPATQAQVRRLDATPANAAAIASAPVAPVTAPVTPVTPAAAVANGLGRPNLGTLEDTNTQIARIKANSTAGPGPSATVIANTGPEAAQKMFDEAQVRNVAARTTTTRRGSTINEGEMAAAMAPVNARARMGEAAANIAGQQSIAALRDSGDTTRANIRESGDAARAALGDQRAQQHLDLQRQEFGLRATGAQLDNAGKERLAAAQAEYQNAKTDTERAAAQEKIQVLSGRAPQQDRFAASTVGGGTAVDPTTGLATAQPQRVIITNQRTGETREVGAGPNAAPAVPPGMKVVGTANGKPVYEDAKGKRFQ